MIQNNRNAFIQPYLADFVEKNLAPGDLLCYYTRRGKGVRDGCFQILQCGLSRKVNFVYLRSFTMKVFKIILAVIVWAFIKTLPAADLTQCVPENTHAAVLMRANLLQDSQSALVPLLQSGELERINKTLNLLSISDSKTLSLDVLTVFFSTSERMMIVDSPCGIEEMTQRLNQRYVLQQKGKIAQTQVNGIPVLEFTWFHPSKPGQTRVYHLAFPGNGTIMIGGHKDPLPMARLSTRTSAEMISLMDNSSLQDVFFFAVFEPEVFHFDLIGIAKNTKNAFCRIGATGGGIQIYGEVNPSDTRKIQQLQTQLSVLSNILLVGLFSGDQALYQTVAKTVVWKESNSKIILSASLSSNTIESIEAHYRRNQNLITLLLTRTIR